MFTLDFQSFDYNEIKSSLISLKKLLWKYEYTAGYYQRLAEGFGFIHAPRKKLPYANPLTELLLSFFADNRALKLHEMNDLFSKQIIEGLEHSRLIVCTPKGDYLSVLRILPLNQYFILVPFRRFSEPQVFIGAESLTFQKYIRVLERPNKILDLASGSGWQLFALPWQGSDCSMLGMDINPNAVAVATLSTRWNGCDWITFRQGDITKDLNELSTKFDLITGHLPILPTAENTRYKGTIHNDGGDSGFDVIREVFPAIPDILESKGTFQLILISLGNEQKPTLLPEIEQLFADYKLKGQVLAIKKIPVELDAYYRGRKEDEYNTWMDFYQRQKMTYWYRLILRAGKDHDKDRNGDRLNYIELFRTDFSKPPDSISLEKIRWDMNHYLKDSLLLKASKQEFSDSSKKLEKEMMRPENLKKSITNYGKELAEKYPNIFPNSGSAIRFWGQLSANQWQPKYLERKLW
ncbi:MAG: methyltransferase domain-containing protein [Candidatus Hodarchaeales archaeon]